MYYTCDTTGHVDDDDLVNVWLGLINLCLSLYIIHLPCTGKSNQTLPHSNCLIPLGDDNQ